ncbi:type II toxin-antitoxin system VapC family toxin [Microbacterium aerolatum]|uniref:type II toxin-antitoxin system VapC family toxin n=1 Tax=Microbacterium aerolatum TaxID=153731 RepID=UPI00384A9873
MILYADTSAIIPLVIDEPTSERCHRLWPDAIRRVSARTTYVEAAAAVASAVRAFRIDEDEAQLTFSRLDAMWAGVDIVEIDEPMMRAAAACAREFRLRGHDAIQCASALRIAGIDVVATSGDRALLRAWQETGLAVADTAG